MQKIFRLLSLCFFSGVLLSHSLYLNGVLGAKIGSLKTAFVSHIVGILSLSLFFLLPHVRSELGRFHYSQLNFQIFIHAILASSFSLGVVYFANRTVIIVGSHNAIPIFLFFITSLSFCFALILKEKISLPALIVLGLATIVLLLNLNEIKLIGLQFGLIAALCVWISRNSQRRISLLTSPIISTLLNYTIIVFLGLNLMIFEIIDLSSSVEIFLDSPIIFLGGFLGVCFQYLMVFTISRYGNFNTNSLIQVSQIFSGLVTRYYH